MILIELISLSGLGEFTHLQFGNTETAGGNGIQDLASLSVTVRFNHGEGPLSMFLECLLSEYIGVVNQLQLSRVDVNIRTNEQLIL